MLLSQHDALAFQTRNLRVGIDPVTGAISIQPCGDPVNFRQLQHQRHHFKRLSDDHFIATNLGVSGHVVLPWKDRRYLLLVSQQRSDFNDLTLKLPSGYVSLEHLHEPIQALDQELAEELILISDKHLLPLYRDSLGLPRPYQNLGYCALAGQVARQQAPTTSTLRYQQTLLNNVECYLHENSGSVQLVYHCELQLPDGGGPFSLWQMEERYIPEKARLEAHWEDREPLWLAELDTHNRLTGNIYQLLDDLLLPANDSQPPTLLSEYFVERRDDFRAIDNHISLQKYLRQ